MSKLKIVQGSFFEGCGIIAHKENTDDFYHLLVHKDKITDQLFVEINEQKYYEKDLIL